MTHAEPKLAGVIGWPIAHSLSPLIHTIWANRNNIDGYYVPFAVEPSFDAFSSAMDSLAGLGFQGVNVTLPHKENALRYAKTASDNATNAGAANMLTFSKGDPYADNSDITGFEKALSAQSIKDGAGKKALVLGAGGAARGIVIALKNKGFSEIKLANRTREKAEALAALFDAGVIDWSDRQSFLPAADLVVNTTSLGMTGEPPLEIDLAGAKKSGAIADIVYSPLQTQLLLDAAHQGLKTIDGLAMLMHQAAPGFQQWFSGKAIIDKELRSALVDALARRKM